MDIPRYLLHIGTPPLATLKPCNSTFKAGQMCCRSCAQLTVNTNCRENDLRGASGQELNQGHKSFIVLLQTMGQGDALSVRQPP